MLRTPLRLLRTVRPVPAATRPAVVRPPALCRPKSSAAAAAQGRRGPPTPKPRVAVDAELDDDDDDMEDAFVDTSMGRVGRPAAGGCPSRLVGD